MATSYERYEKIRDSKHIRDSVVARETGISKSFFSEWKREKYEPKLSKIMKIAEFLECDVIEILGTDYVFNVPRPDLSDDYAKIISVYSSLDEEGRQLFMEIALNMSERAKTVNRLSAYYKRIDELANDSNEP